MESSESPENSDSEDYEFLYLKTLKELDTANEIVKSLKDENAFLQSKLYSQEDHVELVQLQKKFEELDKDYQKQ